MIDWRRYLETGRATENLRGLQPAEGFEVLEIKTRNLYFLASICRLILHDHGDLDLTSLHLSSSTWLYDPESSTPQQLSLSDMAAEAPYRAPAALDFSALGAIVQARLEGGKDHIWEMRVDPKYYEEAILDASKHQQGPLTVGDGPGELWHSVFLRMIFQAYEKIMLWDEIHCRFQNVLQTHESEGCDYTNMDPETWPEPYYLALYQLKDALEATAKITCRFLREALACSPSFRQQLQAEGLGGSSIILRFRKRDPKDLLLILLVLHANHGA